MVCQRPAAPVLHLPQAAACREQLGSGSHPRRMAVDASDTGDGSAWPCAFPARAILALCPCAAKSPGHGRNLQYLSPSLVSARVLYAAMGAGTSRF